MSRAVIRVSDKDNVAIVVQASGIKEGDEVMPGIVATQPIAMGHKIALTDIKEGDAIIRYDHPISFARKSISKGSWINEKNTSIPDAPDLNQIEFVQSRSIKLESLDGYTFKGYKNKDGSVGTKNIFAISTSVQCVAGTTDFIVDKIKNELLPSYSNVDDVLAINHTYGCGVAMDAPAAVIPIRTLKHLAQNPNFGDEIMVVGLGCEKLRPESIVSGNENETIAYLQDESYQGFEGMTSGLMEIAESHLERLNKRTRETCPASDLVAGLQCGGSDAFSGITGNPAVGYAADLIVRAGGTVMFSEVTEVRDAIQPLITRAANEEVAELLKKEMSWYDDYLAMGQSDRSANTSPGNKAGGLSNIVEKALGSVAKSGTSPIVDVIAPGDRVRKKGLNFVATPASDFVCGTLQLAAGMNMHVFITGRGTPYGLREVPVIKISSNSRLAKQWHDLIDLDAGPIASGNKSIEEVGWELFHMILDVASGRQVASDKIGLYNSQVLFNPGPLT